MTTGMFRTLYAYLWYTSRKMLECAGRLPDAEYRENPGYGHGSIHDLFFHVLRTLVGWRVSLETGQQPLGPAAEDYPNLAAIREGYAREQGEWERLLGGWGDMEIAEVVTLLSWRGDEFPVARWRVLQHLILHGMQHHTEVAHLLTAKGQSPGDIDFIFYQG